MSIVKRNEIYRFFKYFVDPYIFGSNEFVSK